MAGLKFAPTALLAVFTMTSFACGVFREVPPPPGTPLREFEREDQLVRRELEFGGLRSANWIAAGEKWARDVATLLRDLRSSEHSGAWVLGVSEPINESGLPATSFVPLHRQLLRACREAGQRNGISLVSGVVGAWTPVGRLDGIVTYRVIGDVRAGDKFTLIYELERTATD